MSFVIWLVAGAAAGWFYGKKRKSAMGPAGDLLLGLGGGLAGGAIMTGLGLPGVIGALIGGVGGGAGIVAAAGALKD